MPYYLESDDREEFKKLLKYQVCAECGGRLEAFYDIKKHLPYLQCKTNPEHKNIAREYREPRELNINTRREIVEEKHGKASTTALEKARLPISGALTQPQAEHILALVYPNVPAEERIRCAILCRDFGLHPLMKEVYILGFKNNKTGKTDYSTVIGITASRKMAADRKGAYSFLDGTPRAATQEEIIKQFGKDSEEERDNLISITWLKGERGNEATGFGLWPKNKEPYGTDKGNTKRNMANIRSERPAYNRLPGEALPPVEVIDEAYTEVPDVGKVNKETGEVVEGEFKEVEETQTTQSPAVEKTEPKEHWCQEHNCAFERRTGRGGTTFYSHKLPGGGWCNEKKGKEQSPAPEPVIETPVTQVEEPQPNTIEDLKETMQLCNWSAMEVGHFCNVDKTWNIKEFADLKPEQIVELIAHIKANPK